MAHGTGADGTPAPAELDPRLRAVADRLARDLPRLHPSFRFEEALAARLAGAAVARTLPVAAGGEGSVVSMRLPEDVAERAALAAYVDGVAFDGDPDGDPMRPLLIGGAPDVGGPLAGRCGVGRLALAPARRLPDGPGRPRGRPGSAGLMPIKLPSFRARRDAYPPDLWTKCPSCE